MTINYPVVSAGDDILATDFQEFRKDVIVNAGDYGVTGGSADAQTLTIDGQVTSFADGDKVRFKAGFTNATTTPTLNVNGEGAITMTDEKGLPLGEGAIIADGYYEATKEGSTWRVTIAGGVSSSVIQAILEEDMPAGTPVGISHYLSQDDVHVAQARWGARPFDLPNGTRFAKVIALDNTRVFLLYYAALGTTTLKGVVATFDFDDNTYTLGTEQDVSAGVIGATSTCDLIDDDKIAINYVLNASNTIVRCKIAEITGDSIALSSEQNVITLASEISATLGSVKSISIDTDKMVVFALTAFSDHTVVVAYSVSGTTISAGSGEGLDSNLRDIDSKLQKLDTDKFVLIRTSQTTGRSQAGSVSGTTITLGTLDDWTSTGGAGASGSCVAIDTDKILVIYRNSGSGNGVNAAKVLTYSGNQIDVEGTEFELEFLTSGYGLIKTNTNEVVAGGQTGNVLRLNVSGTTITSTEIGRSLLITGRATFNNGRSGRNQSTILNGLVVFISSTSFGEIEWIREGFAVSLAGTLLVGGSRGDTRPVQLYSNACQSNLELRGGEYYGIGAGSGASAGVGNGIVEMLEAGAFASGSPVGSRNGEFLAIDKDRFIKA